MSHYFPLYTSHGGDIKVELDLNKLDIPKLSAVPADLAKLTNKVVNGLVEERDFNKLEKKVRWQ